MSFEIVEKKKFIAAAALEEGEASIAKNGNATFRAGDLALVEITDRAVVLSDKASLKIAIRPAAPEEAELAFAVRKLTKKSGKDSGRRSINIGPAIVRCGLEPDRCNGRVELITKDNLLIIPLASAGKGEAARVQRERERQSQENR